MKRNNRCKVLTSFFYKGHKIIWVIVRIFCSRTMYETVKMHERAQVFLVLLDKCVSEKNKKAYQKDKTQDAGSANGI